MDAETYRVFHALVFSIVMLVNCKHIFTLETGVDMKLVVVISSG